ncbi:hypothetical protein [Streptomyces tendae]|uniref:hypothetical protein n=1 Tax=Streptomyces tendae TaxID=1932 RepID=UPI003D709DAC
MSETGPVRICRGCQEVIDSPATEGVLIAFEMSNSGPGWGIWAHKDHLDQVQISETALELALRLWGHQSR